MNRATLGSELVVSSGRLALTKKGKTMATNKMVTKKKATKKKEPPLDDVARAAYPQRAAALDMVEQMKKVPK